MERSTGRRLVGRPWKRWADSRKLEARREEWTTRFFATEVAARPDIVAQSVFSAAFDPVPDYVRGEPVDEAHEKALKELFGTWLAVKVCARRLPTDPIGTGLDALEHLRSAGEISAQVDDLRPLAADLAPDGGPWFDWAREHPEYGLEESEAVQRDVRRGEAATFVKHVDNGVGDFSKSLRRARRWHWGVEFFPLTVLTLVVAAAEFALSIQSVWFVLALGVFFFLVVDLAGVRLVIEPFIEARQRRLLDEAAARLDKVGWSALAAAVSRQNRS
jgi:hypothetical protein